MTAKSFKGSSKSLTEGQSRKRQKVTVDIEDGDTQLFTQQQTEEASPSPTKEKLKSPRISYEALTLLLGCLQIRSSLLSWYDENHRVLPWRRNYHSRIAESTTEESGVSSAMPQQQFMYGIWISEVQALPF